MTLASWLAELFHFAQPDAPSSPIETEPPEDERVPEDTTPVIGMPAGKGIFVQSVEKATAKGTPAGVAERAKDLGLSWVALLTIWQHDDRDRIYDLIEPTIQACTRIGVNVWIWGWPHNGASRIDRFVLHLSQLFDANAVVGVIVNAEKPFYGRPGPAHELCENLRGRLPDAPIGLSSYGNPRFHPRFPWAPFAQICNFGMPQIYDAEHNQGPHYPQDCFAAWHDVGFRKPGAEVLVPTWGASKSHTPQQMRDIIARTPRAPACCWWDLNWLRSSTGRAAVVRELDWYPKESP
jgi:hypothetical protein